MLNESHHRQLRQKKVNFSDIQYASSVALGLKIFHLYLKFSFKERANYIRNYYLGPLLIGNLYLKAGLLLRVPLVIYA